MTSKQPSADGMVAVNTRVPVELKNRLDRLSRSTGVKKEKLVQMALEDLLNSPKERTLA